MGESAGVIVRAAWPGAESGMFFRWDLGWHYLVEIPGRGRIGTGRTEAEAWQAAAKRLGSRN